MTASVKLMTRTMDGCLILNKLGRRRVNCIREWWQHWNVYCRNESIFIGFFLLIPTLFLLAPLLFGPGETNHSELLGTKRVKGGCFFQGVQLCGYVPSCKAEDFLRDGWLCWHVPAWKLDGFLHGGWCSIMKGGWYPLRWVAMWITFCHPRWGASFDVGGCVDDFHKARRKVSVKVSGYVDYVLWC